MAVVKCLSLFNLWRVRAQYSLHCMGCTYSSQAYIDENYNAAVSPPRCRRMSMKLTDVARKSRWVILHEVKRHRIVPPPVYLPGGGTNTIEYVPVVLQLWLIAST